MKPHSIFGSELLALITQYQQLKTEFEQSELKEMQENQNTTTKKFETFQRKLKDITTIETQLAVHQINPEHNVETLILSIHKAIKVWAEPTIKSNCYLIKYDKADDLIFKGEIKYAIKCQTQSYLSPLTNMMKLDIKDNANFTITYTPQWGKKLWNQEDKVNGTITIYEGKRQAITLSEKIRYHFDPQIFSTQTTMNPTPMQTIEHLIFEDQYPYHPRLAECPYSILHEIGKNLKKAMIKEVDKQ